MTKVFKYWCFLSVDMKVDFDHFADATCKCPFVPSGLLELRKCEIP
jgi:hypothetical protein